jgi:hypothetical protein
MSIVTARTAAVCRRHAWHVAWSEPRRATVLVGGLGLVLWFVVLLAGCPSVLSGVAVHVCRGSFFPARCAARWGVFFVLANGALLVTLMRQEPERKGTQITVVEHQSCEQAKTKN